MFNTKKIADLQNQIEILKLQNQLLKLTHQNPIVHILSNDKESLEIAIDQFINKSKYLLS